MKKTTMVASCVVASSLAMAKPTFYMPETIYAATNVPCNVYFARMLDSVKTDAYAYEALSEVGNCWDDRWSWTPTGKDLGRKVQVVFKAWDDDGMVACATTTVAVAKDASAEVKARKTTLALLSASCTNCRFQDQIEKRMREAGFAGYTPVGSHTGDSASQECDPRKGAPHDGYGGYAFGDFLTRYALTVDEIDNLQAEAEKEQLKSFGVKLAPGNAWRKALLKSPIVRIRDGKKVVDVQAWFDKVNGGQAPDYIVIMLGGNGISCVGEGKIEAAVEGQIKSAKALIGHLRAAAPDAKIAITSAFGCSMKQEGWGKNYGARFTAFRAHRNHLAYDRAAIEFVRTLGDAKVFFVPVGQNVDPIGAFPYGQYANAGHATREGGKMAGDAIYAWLANDLAE